jgi:hypothetical protein
MLPVLEPEGHRKKRDKAGKKKEKRNSCPSDL